MKDIPTKVVKHILIAEDTQVQGKKLRYYLQEMGYEVTWAINGQEAWKLIVQNYARYSLLITDINMPEMNGFELVSAIRDKSIDLPVVFITTLDSEETSSFAMGLNPQDFIVKPFRPMELKHRLRNIFDKRDAEEFVRRKLLAIDDSLVGIAIMNLELEISFVNDFQLKLLGLNNAFDATMTPFVDYFDQESREILLSQAVPLLKSSRKWLGKLTGRRKDGTCYPVELNMKLSVKDDVICLIRDISEQVATEAVLRDSAQKALDEKHIADGISKAKDEFLALISHEMRTPLNSILGFSCLLLENMDDPDRGEKIESIRTSGQSLLELINQILDYSRLQADKVVLEKVIFSLSNMLNSISLMFEGVQVGERKKIDIKLGKEIPDNLVGDPARVQQILVNLVTNALKFSPSDSTVQLVMSLNEKGALLFEVIDQGVGIAKSKQGVIFEKFSQAETSTTRRFGGTGLGLAICHQLVELMGGQIGMKSIEGQGSTFWFQIPMVKSETTAKIEEEHQVSLEGVGRLSEKYPLRILIAEDNVINQKLMLAIMKKLGYEVDIVSDGFEAVENCSQHVYDLLLVDLNMPNMDGFQAIEIIRKDSLSSPPYITCFSANINPIVLNNIQKYGMNGYLDKPLNFNKLILELKRAYSYRNAEE